ncbi:MAG: hypothetical protein ACKVYV_10590 [Limisphaerales bacterium]
MKLRNRTLSALAGCLLVMAQPGCGFGPKSGPTHVFVVEPAPAFLSEELAIAKAREYLVKEGLKLEEWPLYRIDGPKEIAPDGTRDRFFERFSEAPASGRVYFGRHTQLRAVDVRLEGNRVVCSMFYGL